MSDEILTPSAIPDDPMQPVPYRVASRRHDTPDVVTVTLTAVGASLAAPAPGQFMMVWIPAIGEIPISVGGIAADRSLELTVRAVGAVSTALVAADSGQVLGLRGPYGTAWPLVDAAGRDAVVMAGGLGIAPLRLAIQSLVSGTCAPRSVTVLIGAREPAQLVYTDEYDAWTALGARIATTVDVRDGSWRGSLGTVTDLLDEHGLLGESGNGLAFVCGPEVMMKSGANALVERGMPREQVYVSLERNMHCGVAKCGRCQLGQFLLCREGAVIRWDRVEGLMAVGER